MGSADSPLPPADSPNLVLAVSTKKERIETLKINSLQWMGLLTWDQYLKREEILENTEMNKDGALTTWVLVDRTVPPDQRTILCSCETYGKPALLAYNGTLEDVWAHGVGSVFCRPEFRGKGYAGRMMTELAKQLDTWQQEKGTRKNGVFSVLYSDIGKRFYAGPGWKPFRSSHVALPPVSRAKYNNTAEGLDVTRVKDMEAEDVRRKMCSDSVIQRYREILKTASKSPPKPKVTFIPDFIHMTWHWAREEFYAKVLSPEKGAPKIKGVSVDDCNVYLAWNRNWGTCDKEKTLYILRALYDEPNSPAEEKSTIEAMAEALRRAQLEAHEWQMDHVEIWNPTPLIEKAIKIADVQAEVVHRETNGITCLKWNGAGMGLGEDVDWYWNERFAWC